MKQLLTEIFIERCQSVSRRLQNTLWQDTKICKIFCAVWDVPDEHLYYLIYNQIFRIKFLHPLTTFMREKKISIPIWPTWFATFGSWTLMIGWCSPISARSCVPNSSTVELCCIESSNGARSRSLLQSLFGTSLHLTELSKYF